MPDAQQTEQSREAALRFLEHAFNYEFDAATAMLAEDARWWVAGQPENLPVAGEKNRAQIGKLLAGLAKAVPKGMDREIHGVTAEGSRVAVEVESRGEWHDGRQYNNRYHFLIEVKDGQIQRVCEYMDTQHLAELL